MSGAFDRACARLTTRTVARVDPWTAALLGELAATGALGTKVRRGRVFDLVTAGKVRYEEWLTRHLDEPDAVASYQVLTHIVSEVRTWASVGGPQAQTALDWAGQVLIERLDDFSQPRLVGALNAVLPGLMPGDPASSARGALTWWSERPSTTL